MRRNRRNRKSRNGDERGANSEEEYVDGEEGGK